MLVMYILLINSTPLQSFLFIYFLIYKTNVHLFTETGEINGYCFYLKCNRTTGFP